LITNLAKAALRTNGNISQTSQEAQTATFKAVTNAGFTTDNMDMLKGILFFSEPEAAASYTVKSLVADKRIQLEVG
jgi:hypothetical protein